MLIRHGLCNNEITTNRGKSIKKLVKILVWGLVVILSIIIFAWLIIQNSRIQTLLVSEVTGILEKKLNTKISISKVDFRPFNKILLEDVLIKDTNQDTLISAKTLKVSLLWFNPEKSLLTLNRVTLQDALINFKSDSSGVLNLSTLLDKLSSDTTTTTSQDTTSTFGFDINNISIDNSKFRLASYKPVKVEFGINFEDLELNKINLDASDFSISGDTIKLSINDLSFVEKSGFEVEKFKAEFSICSKHIYFDKLRIKAEGSNLQSSKLHFDYDGWDKLSTFIKDVNLDAQFQNSLIKTQTLSYIVPSFRDYEIGLVLNGSIKGPICDLRGKNIKASTGSQTLLRTNFHLTGLPDIEQTMIVLDVKELSTSYEDIGQFRQTSTNQPLISLPSNISLLKKITYRGNFTGFINNFVAYGNITSALGAIALDLSIKPDTTQSTAFNGNISATNFDLGKFIGTNSIGRTSLSAIVKGTSNEKTKINAFTDATISQFEANNYNYSNIKVSGNLTNRTYVGSIALNDPNCKLNFLGKVDFSDTIPVFDFSAFVPKIDLVKLNFNKTDSISQASFLFTAKISGNSLDNSMGEIKVVNSSYKNQNGEFKLSDITINANNNKDSKLIELKSEFAEGELRSKYNYANIFDNLEKLMYKYVPALSSDKKTPIIAPTGVDNPEFNDYIIKLRLKKTKKITEVLSPDFRIAENTSVFGIFNPDLNTLTLKIKIPEMSIGSNTFKDISIDGQTKDSLFEASITTPLIDLDGSFIRNLRLSSLVKKNKLDFTFGWDNKQTLANKGIIKALADFNPSAKMDGSIATIDIKPSEFIINDSIWNISPSSVTIDTAITAIHDFNIYNQKQALSITGNISKNPSDSILINLKNIDVSNLNFYIRNMGYELKGRIDGFAKVSEIYTSPTLLADIGINKMVVNKRELGNVKFTSKWFNAEKKLSLNLNNAKNDSLTFDAKGDIYTETNKIDFQINIPRIMLDHFGPILQGVVSGLSGSVNGLLTVSGTTNKPLVNGILNVNNGKLSLDFMKANYTINDHIEFKNSDILFKNFKILDVNKHIATVNGSVKTGYFNDFNIDLNVNPTNFQCINTTERDNDLFYGTVYATGLVTITGKPDNINMNIAVRTDNKTMLSLPLSSTSQVTENNFITFTNNNPDDIFIEEEKPIKEESSTNMNLTFDLQVTPEAEVQIIIDKKLGDIIKASGSGNLKMDVNPGEDKFKIYGDYNIEKGDYLFTLQGVINKKFKIEQGGTLSWNGDPTDATMNIKAIYKVKTALNQLLSDYTGKYDTRVPVDCQILLTQKLMSPGIKFNIDVPNADNETKVLVESALNTEDNINRQFLSLLVINSFMPPVGGNVPKDPMQGNDSNIGSGLYKTASEMLSNQLSNWISQWSKTVDIGLNYRPGSTTNNNLSSDEVELALSTQLLDDRVSINGNVDMGARNNSNPIAGDFNIDVKLNKSGKLRFKAFARSNDELISNTSQTQYTTGAGFVYREEFNNFHDLLHRIKNTFKQETIVVPLKDSEQSKENQDTKKDIGNEEDSIIIKK